MEDKQLRGDHEQGTSAEAAATSPDNDSPSTAFAKANAQWYKRNLKSKCKELLVTKLSAQAARDMATSPPSVSLVTAATRKKLNFPKRPTGSVADQPGTTFNIWSRLKELPTLTDMSTVTAYDTVTIQRMVDDYFSDSIQIGMSDNPCHYWKEEKVTYKNNITSVILVGFPNFYNFNIPMFLLLLIIYSVNIYGNLLIMALCLLTKHLQTPMYFFITQLSLCDIILTTDILPILLHIVLYDGCTMSLIGCIAQFYVFATSESSECLLLSVMSYDRYLAICDPLRYHSIINYRFCVKSVILIWMISFILTITDLQSMCSLHFCGPNVIDHFYCDFEPILQLSCSDTFIIHIETLTLIVLALTGPFIIIVMSYVYIVFTVLRIPSFTGRQKAFSTCSSHLMVVSIFFGTLSIVYVFPAKHFRIISKVMALFYTLITPLLNPIIYTFRNKDFKKVFDKIKYLNFCKKL
ncbi:olfactory receptor 11A1-like [Pseudophryne corroboree]|uniref:olfactory receptor 11A1-like n=1 Tax=Pseudophryne corroboree TaxID=495146 RepID=UPI003081D742